MIKYINRSVCTFMKKIYVHRKAVYCQEDRKKIFEKNSFTNYVPMPAHDLFYLQVILITTDSGPALPIFQQ